jgi:hypothetical protein
MTLREIIFIFLKLSGFKVWKSAVATQLYEIQVFFTPKSHSLCEFINRNTHSFVIATH